MAEHPQHRPIIVASSGIDRRPALPPAVPLRETRTRITSQLASRKTYTYDARHDRERRSNTAEVEGSPLIGRNRRRPRDRRALLRLQPLPRRRRRKTQVSRGAPVDRPGRLVVGGAGRPPSQALRGSAALSPASTPSEQFGETHARFAPIRRPVNSSFSNRHLPRPITFLCKPPRRIVESHRRSLPEHSDSGNTATRTGYGSVLRIAQPMFPLHGQTSSNRSTHRRSNHCRFQNSGHPRIPLPDGQGAELSPAVYLSISSSLP
jgi:hypothetical protein